MKVAIVGAAGQLGTDLRQTWAAGRPADEVVGLTRADLDVTKPEAARKLLTDLRPDAVVNLAAYHRVDDIEDDPRPAFEVNAVGAGNLATVCRDLDCALLYVSTDYVFPGEARTPRVETDPVGPISAYGVSKLAAEQMVRNRCPRHFVVRTCGLYGRAGSAGKGGNFVETMLRLGGEGRTIKVVDDQVVTPTATLPLAGQLCALLQTDAYGTYHATCQGECSWFDFAAEIFRQAGLTPDLLPQSSEAAGARARRPAYSVLANAALQRLGIDQMPAWQDALAGYLASRSS